jgi:hypothetical protein
VSNGNDYVWMSAALLDDMERMKMENQHRQITGYRDLTQDEIDLMNSIKSHGKLIGDLIETLRLAPGNIDQRWVAIGTTHLQQGLMALTRAVARPTTF